MTRRRSRAELDWRIRVAELLFLAVLFPLVNLVFHLTYWSGFNFATGLTKPGVGLVEELLTPRNQTVAPLVLAVVVLVAALLWAYDRKRASTVAQVVLFLATLAILVSLARQEYLRTRAMMWLWLPFGAAWLYSRFHSTTAVNVPERTRARVKRIVDAILPDQNRYLLGAYIFLGGLFIILEADASWNTAIIAVFVLLLAMAHVFLREEWPGGYGILLGGCLLASLTVAYASALDEFDALTGDGAEVFKRQRATYVYVDSKSELLLLAGRTSSGTYYTDVRQPNLVVHRSPTALPQTPGMGIQVTPRVHAQSTDGRYLSVQPEARNTVVLKGTSTPGKSETFGLVPVGREPGIERIALASRVGSYLSVDGACRLRMGARSVGRNESFESVEGTDGRRRLRSAADGCRDLELMETDRDGLAFRACNATIEFRIDVVD